MKVDFNRVLLDLQGEELKEPKGVNKAMEPITLKDVCANALVGGKDGDENKKLERYKLGLDIAKATAPIEIKSEDIVLIKGCIKSYPPLYFGQAVMMLEGEI